MDARRMWILGLLAISVAAVVLATGPARADGEDVPEPPPADAPEPEPPPPDEPERDPFSPSEKMRNQTEEGAGARFVPREGAGPLPKLALRGYIEDAGGNTVALLEVEGSATYLVRAGDTVTLPSRRGNEVIRVMEVGNLSLRVQIGELKHDGTRFEIRMQPGGLGGDGDRSTAGGRLDHQHRMNQVFPFDALDMDGRARSRKRAVAFQPAIDDFFQRFEYDPLHSDSPPRNGIVV